MKKIIMPLEGTTYRREFLDFAAALNTRSRVLLTAALVPEAAYAAPCFSKDGVGEPDYLPVPEDADKVIARNSARVKRYCEEHDIACQVHEDRFDFAIGAIRRETRFADLLLLSSSHFFEMADGHQPNAYMKQVLRRSECPVLLLPEMPKLPGEILLAYDGSESSVFAIRQFAYLFPEFNRLRTTLVCINDRSNARIPEDRFIRELCEHHFKNFRMLQLRIRTDEFYDTWVGMMQYPWLVSGAFGRSDLSQLVHHSFLTRLIQTHQVPLFVAHR